MVGSVSTEKASFTGGTFVSATTNIYNAQGQVVETISPSGLATGTIYNSQGQVEYTGPLQSGLATTGTTAWYNSIPSPMTNSFLTATFSSYTENLYDQLDMPTTARPRQPMATMMRGIALLKESARVGRVFNASDRLRPQCPRQRVIRVGRMNFNSLDRVPKAKMPTGVASYDRLQIGGTRDRGDRFGMSCQQNWTGARTRIRFPQIPYACSFVRVCKPAVDYCGSNSPKPKALISTQKRAKSSTGVSSFRFLLPQK
jgi:hypothetical protein